MSDFNTIAFMKSAKDVSRLNYTNVKTDTSQQNLSLLLLVLLSK